MVLTGAATRIPDAIELLAAGRGKRLLITGVHRDTSAREIARLTPALHQNYFTCCIDLDRSALNTFGNALEIKRWAREHNFNSLIVVTSNWHMPRAMAEVAAPASRCYAHRLSGAFGTGESRSVVVEPGHARSSTVSEYLKYPVRAVCACGSIRRRRPEGASKRERHRPLHRVQCTVLRQHRALSDRGAADVLHAVPRHYRGGEIVGPHQSQAAARRRRHRLRNPRP